MQVPLSAELTRILALAHASGVEVTLAELAVLFGCADGPMLLSATAVMERLKHVGLILKPDVEVGGFEDARVLRSSSASSDVSFRDIMSTGENGTVEFKSSMLCSVKDWEKHQKLLEFPALPGEVLKTICAFLNTDGGHLFVGVDDDGIPCEGIALDLSLKGWNEDKWQLHFSSLVQSNFYDSGSISAYVRTKMLTLEGFSVFHVQVTKRTERSFVKKIAGKPYEFFIRNGPRTDSLDLVGFYSYMRSLPVND